MRKRHMSMIMRWCCSRICFHLTSCSASSFSFTLRWLVDSSSNVAKMPLTDMATACAAALMSSATEGGGQTPPAMVASKRSLDTFSCIVVRHWFSSTLSGLIASASSVGGIVRRLLAPVGLPVRKPEPWPGRRAIDCGRAACGDDGLAATDARLLSNGETDWLALSNGDTAFGLAKGETGCPLVGVVSTPASAAASSSMACEPTAISCLVTVMMAVQAERSSAMASSDGIRPAVSRAATWNRFDVDTSVVLHFLMFFLVALDGSSWSLIVEAMSPSFLKSSIALSTALRRSAGTIDWVSPGLGRIALI
eukprot:Unigene3863_Nuclearia_a/m.11780 Unigene3863_Nuclearia_a/g.11780  ORF Unigene3863_Nuclearia_a/g.11780 Unigene3863_Nuclearia_a/m.11780 type:complete len:308 (+) Unigene3863_Nuclearia_a:1636-2559(+)